MADIQVKRKTSLSVTETFSVDGAPIDLDSGVPTVTATAPDGTTTSPTATHVGAAGSGQYRIVLAAQPEVTWRDLTWTGTIGGQSQTLEGRVEWVGDLLFTLAQFRQLKVVGGTPFANATTYPDAQILETRAEVLDEFTDILGFPPVPRFRRETFDGTGGYSLPLPGGPYAQRILSVTVNGVAQTASNYQIGVGNTVEAVASYSYGTAFTWGRRNVTIEWVEGWPRPKGDAADVAMLRAAMKLSPGLSSTASTVSTPDGAVYSFDPAGQVTRGGTTRHFGVPAIDSFLNRHAARVGVA